MAMCNCKVCSDHRRWMAAINPQTEEAKAAVDELLSRLEAAETDTEVWRAKYECTWETPFNQRPILGTRNCHRCNKVIVANDAATMARDSRLLLD